MDSGIQFNPSDFIESRRQLSEQIYVNEIVNGAHE